MVVEARVDIDASREAVWAIIVDIECAASFVHGIDKIEILEKPADGLIGLKWRETRMLFGKPASADKWITAAVENEYYSTRAEDQGFVFLSTLRIDLAGDGVTLRSAHASQPRSLGARLMSIPMGLLFKGTIRKALLQDLQDIKVAVENTRSPPRSLRQSASATGDPL